MVLATITTAYTTISSFLFRQTSRPLPPGTSGNFTGNGQFGNYTGLPQFGNMNSYGGSVNNLTILAVIIAIVSVLWLGLSLRKAPLTLREVESVSTADNQGGVNQFGKQMRFSSPTILSTKSAQNWAWDEHEATVRTARTMTHLGAPAS